MDDLKKALMENPAAASLILPKEIGQLVKYIKMLEGKMIINSKVKAAMKKGKNKAPALTPDFLKSIEDQI